ncbi:MULTISPECIES: LysR family transcriptional regulator [Xanthomonas]|uniref:LysR family transcriptional regulator n=1 Tax=Xanthomonas TaxID=338 RepID=UPI000360A98F|nr:MULTISPECIES: LysR family transcriptional regulator [Xanthomonas]MDQ7758419.1 LysR substrate-binding domain-containing protein [Xanthomonas sontii]TYD36390.1 LysR family transcriptional regulator [Xanthomonas sontii]UZK06859.1 LysR family transcriptional regulator [Xanthomonas sontii]
MSHDLNDTLIFVKVVEQGSFIAAANALGLPKTTVSRKVQDLEARLGARLLHRTTRRLGLTEAGAVYHEHCQRIARELEEAESAVGQLQAGPRGWLRFSVPYSAGISWVAPILGEFHRQHPEVRLEMIMTSDKVDPIAEGVDVALHMGTLPDSTMVARKLATFRTQVFASPYYIERHGEPLHPDDLQHHRTLALSNGRGGGNRLCWPLRNGKQSGEFLVQPILLANDSAALIGGLVCGEGLVLASDATIKPLIEAGKARRVLGGWVGPDLDFNAVFPGGRMLSPKVRAFVDFLVDKLNFDVSYMMAQCPAKLATQQAEDGAEFTLCSGVAMNTQSLASLPRVAATPAPVPAAPLETEAEDEEDAALV